MRKSENTVKTHCSRAFDKLGAKRRTQAVQLGKEFGLLRLSPYPVMLDPVIPKYDFPLTAAKIIQKNDDKPLIAH